MALTDKQRLFVEEYPKDFNASAAARRAGYSEKTAGSIGFENLQKPEIAAALAEATEERFGRARINADEVFKQIARIGFVDVRDLFTWDDDRAAYVPSDQLTSDQAAAISAVKSDTTHYTDNDGNRETRIKLELKTESKIRALELLAKHFAMLTDKRADEFGGEPVSVTEVVIEHEEDG